MYYGEIKPLDIANGEGVRVSLFVSGCRRHCKGCFNAKTWDFTFGEPFTREVEDRILEQLRPYYVAGLTVLGGDPFEPENQRVLAPFLARVKAAYPEKPIWCYTGYVLEEDFLSEGSVRNEWTDAMLSQIDVLVDGPFIEEQKDISLVFRGSANQRILDLPRTLGEKKVCWKELASP